MHHVHMLRCNMHPLAVLGAGLQSTAAGGEGGQKLVAGSVHNGAGQVISGVARYVAGQHALGAVQLERLRSTAQRFSDQAEHQLEQSAAHPEKQAAACSMRKSCSAAVLA